MKYLCTDRGSERCPCHLMAAGQCYTCTMVRDGICSCEDKAGWQDVCPYTEYCQQGEAVMEAGLDCMRSFDVLSKTSYSKDLHVIKLAVPPGFSQVCSRPGAYIMAEALGWRTPVSLLRTDRILRKGAGSSHGAEAEFLVKAAGPKTGELVRMAEEEGVWLAAGPYFNGLLQAEGLEGWMNGAGELTVITRGSAAAPLIHIMHMAEESHRNGFGIRLYLDDETLPGDFKEEYLLGQVYEKIRLGEEETLKRMHDLVHELAEQGKPVMVLASPYYTEQLLAALHEGLRSRVITANYANLCCGMGICGSCSYTDRDGITVKLCKCSRAVVEWE